MFRRFNINHIFKAIIYLTFVLLIPWLNEQLFQLLMLNQNGPSRADAELLKSRVTLECLDQCMVEELYKMVRTHDRLLYWSTLFTLSD